MVYGYDEDYCAKGTGIVDRENLEEEERKLRQKPGVVSSILRIGTMGGRIQLNSKTKHLYIPGCSAKIKSAVEIDYNRIRELTRLGPRRCK